MEATLNLTVDSRDRDRSRATTPASYTYTLEDTVRNVSAITLTHAVYPRSGDDLYVNLHIEELSPPSVWSKNHVNRGSFAQLPLLHVLNEFRDDTRCREQRLAKPIAKLSKLTLRFLKHDGTAYDMADHLLIFRVRYLTTSESIEFRASGERSATDVSLRALDLPPHYTAAELNGAYLARKQAIVQSGAHASELVMLKAAYRDLVRRLQDAYREGTIGGLHSPRG